jgi:hypothetical protein
MIGYADRTRATVNWLKAMYFDRPWWTPASAGILPAAWMKYRADMEAVVLAHPRLFPGYEKGRHNFDELGNPTYRAGRFTDAWGCVWENPTQGMVGQVTGHPLADWSAFESWTPPDPLKDGAFGPRNWQAERDHMARERREGRVVGGGGLAHSLFFLLLTDLRGFENALVDMALDEPRLHKLMAVIQDYNVAVIREYLRLGMEVMYTGEDLGMQHALPISPAMWRRYIKPAYEAMFGPCRDAGVPVYLHCDGHILDIIPDLIEVGVRVLNPQFRANGLDGLVRVARGRVAINQDLDRQLFPFASPAQLEDHIAETHAALSLPEGGLMLVAEIGPDVSPTTADAIFGALERVCRLPPPEEQQAT